MSEKSVAVAFGGGGARGLSHIWVMDALDELGITPVALSGTSIGALAAACYGSGLSGQFLHDYVVALFGNRSEVFNRFWQLRPRSFSDLFANQNQPGQFDPLRIVEAFLPQEIKHDFSELSIPVSISATDYFLGEEVIFTQGNLKEAIAASMAIPALFKPVEKEGRLLVDGGFVNPMPVSHLRSLADIVIAVDVIGVPEVPEEGNLKAFEMGFGVTQIMMQTIQQEKMRHDKVDILIKPNISAFRVLDFLKAEDIMQSSKPAKGDLKRRLAAQLEM